MTKNHLIAVLPQSIKQIWAKLDNKKWSKLYKMRVTLGCSKYTLNQPKTAVTLWTPLCTVYNMHLIYTQINQ